jgi:hypothetical protein
LASETLGIYSLQVLFIALYKLGSPIAHPSSKAAQDYARTWKLLRVTLGYNNRLLLGFSFELCGFSRNFVLGYLFCGNLSTGEHLLWYWWLMGFGVSGMGAGHGFRAELPQAVVALMACSYFSSRDEEKVSVGIIPPS